MLRDAPLRRPSTSHPQNPKKSHYAYVLRSRPLQALHDCAAHHPVLVALTEEAQLFREMADALAIARLRERICKIRAPIAALRAVGVELALQVSRNLAARLGVARTARSRRHLEA